MPPARLAAAWTEAVCALGGSGPALDRTAAELVAAYREPHRRYHTARHVEAVLTDAGWLAGQLELGPLDRAVVAAAACAHDVVYAGRPGADERDSAAWADGRLRDCGVQAGPAAAVRRLVLATAEHDADPADVPAVALLDADLAILAATPGDYAGYLAAVRAEYAHVEAPQWRAGRAAVLGALLDRPALYLSGPGRDRWEVAARRNVTDELASLTPTPTKRTLP